jgi:hypothetical protein
MVPPNEMRNGLRVGRRKISQHLYTASGEQNSEASANGAKDDALRQQLSCYT